jgi:hypothetical protein
MTRTFKSVIHQKDGNKIIFGEEIKFMCEVAENSYVTTQSECGFRPGGNELDKKGSIQ